MKHIAQQIIEAAAHAFESHIEPTVNVYEHRSLSLAEDLDELPAISVDYGEDAPFDADGAATFDVIQSVLTVNVTAIVTGTDERDVREDLLKLRADIHKAITTPTRLGLAGVLSVNYGGAEPPELIFEGDVCVGALVCVWGVMYQTDANNPEQ